MAELAFTALSVGLTGDTPSHSLDASAPSQRPESPGSLQEAAVVQRWTGVVWGSIRVFKDVTFRSTVITNGLPCKASLQVRAASPVSLAEALPCCHLENWGRVTNKAGRASHSLLFL